MMGSKVKCYSYVYRQTHTNAPCVRCSDLQLELETMKNKLEKIERERNEYKMQMDKLENRVCLGELFYFCVGNLIC